MRFNVICFLSGTLKFLVHPSGTGVWRGDDFWTESLDSLNKKSTIVFPYSLVDDAYLRNI
jgi:hypothetical protein